MSPHPCHRGVKEPSFYTATQQMSSVVPIRVQEHSVCSRHRGRYLIFEGAKHRPSVCSVAVGWRAGSVGCSWNCDLVHVATDGAPRTIAAIAPKLPPSEQT